MLEAISLFTGVRSFRGARNSQMIFYQKDLARLSMSFFAQARSRSAQMTISDKGRDTTLDGVKLPAASSLIGTFCAVVFSPDRMSLVDGAAKERRKFIDAAISQSSPKYAQALYRFNQIIDQRNVLLKSISYGKESEAMLDVWDISAASFGSYICHTRREYIKKLEQSAQKIYDGISSGREPLSLKYSCSFCQDNDADIKQLEAMYLERLAESRGNDIKLGYTYHGAQRDDMEILINRLDSRAYGSQGQKRSAVLSLKLAESELLSQSIGEQPVALLDDVMSELDSMRQAYLLNRLDGWQVFISCCDPSPLKLMDKGNIYIMSSGRMSKYDKTDSNINI